MMIGPGELDTLRRESLHAMPDTVHILRPTNVRDAGGYTPTDFAEVGTSPCRLTASILSGGGERTSAGQLVSMMAYTLTVPAGTDVKPSDRVEVSGVTFEVTAIKDAASWNLTDSCTLMEIRH